MPTDVRHNSIHRRTLLASMAATGAAGVFLVTSAWAHGEMKNQVKDIVLIHGAWHGAWCWEPVRALLEPEGFRVHALTLPGLAERAGELSADIGLQTHIDDAIAQITALELDSFVLVGHSYGGMVITGIADALKPSIAHIVYLDAAFPKDGETMLSYGEPRPRKAVIGAEQAMRGLAVDGIGIPTFPPASLGIPEDHPLYDFVAKRLTPHPLKTWLDPIALSNGGAEGLAGTYVLCTDPQLPMTQFPWVAEQLKAKPDWRVVELATGHEAMITDPAGTSRIIVAATSSPKQSQEG